MTPRKIEGANLNLGAPTSWDPDRDGECATLSVRVDEHNGTRIYSSAWYPSPAEIEAINAGRAVVLTIWGEAHPPVWIATEVS